MACNYDEGWRAKWDDANKYGPMSRHVRRIIREIVQPLDFESVLDVGCGQGSFLEELLIESPSVRPHGVDISAVAVELARLNVPSGRFWVLDVEREHLNERFDLVVCSEVLEHIPDDQAALRNLAHMTGKYLVISTVQGRMRRFEAQGVGHVRNYARRELTRKVRKSGFSIARVVEWGFPFYSPLYRNLLELTGAKGTTGELGFPRRMASSALYYLFMLNSSRRGDEMFVLAERAEDAPETD